MTLEYFDTSLPNTIQVDASGTGIDAILLQNSRPVHFASRTLTEPDRRYVNIEREFLSVVFRCERLLADSLFSTHSIKYTPNQ